MYQDARLQRTVDAARVSRKVFNKIIPIIFLGYVISFMDRVNLGFAALQMNKELGFSPLIFAGGVGVFFLGYLLFEIPSNAILYHTGARLWIARILITWGILASMQAMISGPTSFFVLRALLGIAEAGFVPGVLLYMTYWIPQGNRGSATALFLLGFPVSMVIGAPVSGAMLGLNAIGGLSGWQWLFILQGIPAVILGIAVLWLMPDKPEDAAWLNKDEKRTLNATLEAEQSVTNRHAGHARSILTAIVDPRILMLAITNFMWGVIVYGLAFWLPQIIKGLGQLSNLQVGLVAAVPYAISGVVMIMWGRHSDRVGERIWHVAIAMFLAGGGFLLSAYASSPYLALAGITLAATGIMAYAAVFFVMPALYLTGAAAAGGIAMVTTLGNLGGFVGPYGIGIVRTEFRDFSWALIGLAFSAILGGLIVLLLGARRFRAEATGRSAIEMPPIGPAS